MQVYANDAVLMTMHGMGIHRLAVEVIKGDDVTEVGEFFPPGLKMPLVATVSGTRYAADSTVFVSWSVCELVICAPLVFGPGPRGA